MKRVKNKTTQSTEARLREAKKKIKSLDEALANVISDKNRFRSEIDILKHDIEIYKNKVRDLGESNRQLELTIARLQGYIERTVQAETAGEYFVHGATGGAICHRVHRTLVDGERFK